MSYRLRVADEKNRELDWFYRFMDETGYLRDENTIDTHLKPWGGRNVDRSPYIEFDTEAQALLFMLKWA